MPPEAGGQAGSAKGRIADYLRAHVGEIVTAKELQAVAEPVSEWARRVRELRDEDRWPIATNHDTNALKPGEYLLEHEPPKDGARTFKRGISQRVRAEVFDRDGSTCQMCGLAAGDTDPETGRIVRLHLGHIVDKSLGGSDEASNLRTLCSSCNQGAKNLTQQKPTAIWLLAQVRRANLADQREVFDWLAKKFDGK